MLLVVASVFDIDELRMKKRFLPLALAAFAFVALGSRDARAQTRERRSWWSEGVPPVTSALELSLSTGYTQAFGALPRETGLPSAARPGLGFEPGIGLRIDPWWSAAVLLQYAEVAATEPAEARSITAGVGVARHFAPVQRLDPWIEIASGYRVLRERRRDQPENVVMGVQLARARLGLDVRMIDGIAFAPFAGADVSMLVWRDTAGTSTFIDPRFGTFVFAGIQSRADLGF